MGGCTNCKGKDVCDDHKGSMMSSVEQTMERLYPTRTWGEPDDAEPMGLPADELAGLADELAATLNAATFVRPGDDEEACDFIYVLCLGRTPCIVQVRDHGVAAPDEWAQLADASSINELYLRVCVSQRARVAAVQQVAIDLVRVASGLGSGVDQRGGPGGYLVRERPRAGVYDAPLLPRMQKLVAILPAYDLLHVDFGDIAHAPPGFRGGIWRELYGAEPSIANYLFYAQPTTMVATTFLEPVPR